MLKLIISLLVLCPFLIICQSNSWIEMDADCQEANYFVQYVSDNNHMIIGIPSLGESYITTDQGQSWQRFPWASGRFIIEVQSESNDDDFYFTNGSLIYKYDKITESASVVHDNSDYGYVKKAVLLNNGERLVIYSESGNVSIGRFDTDGLLVTSNLLSTENLKVEFLYQEGFPSYITKSTYGQVVKTMLSVNPLDLSLGNEFVIDAHTTGMRYLDGRLFSSNEFSDDGGLSWTEISSPVDVRWGTSIDILENQVVIIAPDHILHSTDSGESFTVKSHNLDSNSSMRIDFHNDGQELMLYNSSNISNVLISDDNGSTWSQYDNSFNLPNVTRIASLENDHLMANTINCNGRYLVDNEWNDISISDSTYIWDFAGLANGNFVGVNAGNIYLSEDSGANWELVVPDIYESGLTTKEGVVYVSGYSGVAVSEDNGETYTLFESQDLPTFRYASHFSDLSTVYYESDGVLTTYDFVTEVKVSLDKTLDPLTHITSETDWSGKGFYLLEYESPTEDQFVIVRSSSPGSSFESKLIPIAPVGSDHKMETDRNGNVLIYNEDQIMISQDQGDTWHDITPDINDLWLISDLTVSYDNYLYLSTVGTGILKYPCKLDADIIDCPLLLVENEEEDSLDVYPNPFFDHVNLKVGESDDFEVNIYDSNGHLVQTNNNVDRIELESLLPGIYLLEFFDLESSQKVYKKIVK